ncbi:MAG: SH3 domain-containing protein [Desulfohalobiaceae bacterium]|nr:SH3 domain-containing protein [Desulfohalobiaceae bacterium]
MSSRSSAWKPCAPGPLKSAAGLLLVSLLLLSACRAFAPEVLPDLKRYTQKASQYVGPAGPPSDFPGPARPLQQKEDFLQKYFRPWHAGEPIFPKDTLFWPLEPEWEQRLYGENTLPRSPEWLASLFAKAQPDRFPLLDARGITLTNTDLRAMPTRKPAFHDFDEPGEGYPFDYFQNSALWANTPVHIVHVSRDKQWLLVEAGWVFGWVQARDIGLVDSQFVADFKQSEMAAFIKDRVPVIDAGGTFRFTGRIGGLLPVIDRQNDTALVLIAAADAGQRAVIRQARLSLGSWAGFPLDPAPENLARMADVFLGQVYGWGGLYQNRDCSALLRDLFTPFAVWLPRNSSQQAEQGRVVSLEGLSSREKTRLILEKGVPFLTLLRKPGHIMLYIGSSQGRPLVMHSLWGLKTRDFFQGETRYVVGRTVITSLTPGKELPFFMRPRSTLLKQVQSMNILLDPS